MKLLNSIEEFDMHIFAQFERFCHFTQRTIGLASTHWLYVILFAYIVTVANIFRKDIIAEKPWSELVIDVVWLLVAFWVLYMLIEINKTKQRLLGDMTDVVELIPTPILVIHARVVLGFGLCVALPLTSYDIFVRKHHHTEAWDVWLSILLLDIILYVILVTDLPPGKSKLKQLLSKLSSSFKHLPAPQPQGA